MLYQQSVELEDLKRTAKATQISITKNSKKYIKIAHKQSTSNTKIRKTKATANTKETRKNAKQHKTINKHTQQ